ncbi:MAG: hypothetical protein IPK66_17850 [Rhodospirillales bacterium]|nr:hypothetical protein [Rhodospirillales bacterium]
MTPGAGRRRLALGAPPRPARSPGEFDGRLDDAEAALDRALSEAIEAQALLERVQSSADLDPRELERIESGCSPCGRWP